MWFIGILFALILIAPAALCIYDLHKDKKERPYSFPPPGKGVQPSEPWPRPETVTESEVKVRHSDGSTTTVKRLAD